MSKKSMLEKLGLTEDVLKPKANDEKERLEILEDAFAELCEIVFAEENEEEQADD